MNVIWLVIGIGVVGALAKGIAWSRQRAWPADLGFVSHQWLAQQRLSRGSDSQR